MKAEDAIGQDVFVYRPESDGGTLKGVLTELTDEWMTIHDRGSDTITEVPRGKYDWRTRKQ